VWRGRPGHSCRWTRSLWVLVSPTRAPLEPHSPGAGGAEIGRNAEGLVSLEECPTRCSRRRGPVGYDRTRATPARLASPPRSTAWRKSNEHVFAIIPSQHERVFVSRADGPRIPSPTPAPAPPPSNPATRSIVMSRTLTAGCNSRPGGALGAHEQVFASGRAVRYH